MAYCGPRGIPLSTFLRWPVEDQEAALAWQDHQARCCSRCGAHPGEYDEHGGAAYHVETHLCRGCLALAIESDKQRPKGDTTAGERAAASARQMFLVPGPAAPPASPRAAPAAAPPAALG